MEIVAQYQTLDKERIAHQGSIENVPAQCWTLLNLSRMLVNHGQHLQANLSLSEPVALGICYAERALNLAPESESYLRAVAYQLVADARRKLSPAPYNDIVLLCDQSVQELNKWRGTCDPADHESLQMANTAEFNARQNKAMFLHYADRYDEALECYESLLANVELTSAPSQKFTLHIQLANVLNNARRYAQARRYVFSDAIEAFITEPDQRFRLHSARSLSYASSGRMAEALDEINEAMFYFNDVATEVAGNIMVRAARYYIKVSAFEHATTLLPDLLVKEESYSGMDYQMNLALAGAELLVEHGTETDATGALERLRDLLDLSEEQYEQRSEYDRLRVRFLRRFRDPEVAYELVSSMVGNTSLPHHRIEQQQLLLEYCEVSLQLHINRLLKPQIDALFIGSFLDSQWVRWRAALCMAREHERRGNLTAAIQYAKLSCSQMLTLSVPLLRFEAQRQRIAGEVITPFLVLENLLSHSGAVLEAQVIRATRVEIEVQLRSTKPLTGERHADISFSSQVRFNDEELAFIEELKVAVDHLVSHHELGKPWQDGARDSGLVELINNADVTNPPQFRTAPVVNSPIAENRLHLSYWFDGEEVWMTAVDYSGACTKPLHVSIQELRLKVFRLRVGMEESTHWRAHAQELYTILIHPIEKALDDVDTLVVSVTDVLRLVPFGALWDQSGYLAERLRIIHSHTFRIADVQVPPQPRVLLLGTGCHSTDDSPLSPLAELTALQDNFSSVTSLVDQDWSPEQCAERLSTGVDVVHICCHYVYKAENPERSYFKLSDGRRLGVRELLELEGWRRVKLVFLATCNSAVGGGQDNLSLADHFIEAGVSTVIGSFRPVKDHESVEYCSVFYSELKNSRCVSKALHQAQLNMLGAQCSIWSAYELWQGTDCR